ncbi:hypothetical protein DPMN_088876 [Dreissena polymorpha]|uniref:LRRCT domain-containing protein n=1 Tax=Dreissena polymorpha TaxID=45954 RepID=A0A9D4KVS3_DREPO|nr:hypothetical protein DPMN_088876 [Dreissena polymorpha]
MAEEQSGSAETVGCSSLRSNRLGNIPRAAFSGLTQLTKLDLYNNTLVCDCHLRWLIVTAQAGESNVTVTGAVCSEPAHLKGREIRNVSLADLNCSMFDNIEIVKAPNATYDVEPNMKIVFAIDVITDPYWQNQISYKWFWYLPVTTSTGDQIIEKQPLPPTSSYDKYFKLSLSGKELNLTIPDVKTPVMADNTAEYDLYQDLTDDRLFSINISHKFDHRVVNFTVKGKELEKKKSSTSQAPVYIGIVLGAVVLVVTAAGFIFIRQKRHNTPSSPMEDSALTPIDAGRGYQIPTDSIHMGSDVEPIADRDIRMLIVRFFRGARTRFSRTAQSPSCVRW